MHLFVPIVEGHGEVEAIPALIHRIAASVNAQGRVRINAPIRVKSGSYLNDPEYFRRYTALAAAKASQNGGTVVIILDCEDQCPVKLSETIVSKAQQSRPDVEHFITLAVREFESWFLIAAASLRGVCGLPAELSAPADPENIRNAKGWLSQQMIGAYDPVIHQLQLCRIIDLDQARASASFDRFYRFVVAKACA